MGKLPVLHDWQLLLLAFVMGILGLRFPLPALVSFALFASLVRPLRAPLFYALLATAFAGGLLWGWARMPDNPGVFPEWMKNREKVAVTAQVTDVRSAPGNRLLITLSDVDFETGDGNRGRLPGKLLWTWELPTVWPEPGQQVQATLRIKPVHGMANPGTRNSEWYWQRKGVFYKTFTSEDQTTISLTPEGGSFRSSLRQRFFHAAGQSQGAAVLAAVVLGERFLLSSATVDIFQLSSLSHSLAQSGLHLGFVVSIGLFLAWGAGLVFPDVYLRVPRIKLAVLLAFGPALFYLWLGQFSPSLLRAGLMFAFWGILLLAGRGRVVLDGLFVAVGMILLVSPLSAYELGLQLSALAVAGIALFCPFLLGRLIPWKGAAGKILAYPASILLAGVSANIVLLPLLFWHFNWTSPHLYLNILWLPLLGVVALPLGFFGLAVAAVPGLYDLGAMLISHGVSICDWMLGVLSGFETRGWLRQAVVMRPTWPLFLAYWLMVLWVLFLLAGKWRQHKHVLLLSLLFGLIFVGAGMHRVQKGDFTLTLLDVGQGQAVILETGGKRVLVDGGGSWNPDFDFGKIFVAPALTWGRFPTLDQIVLSHHHGDHLRGLLFPLNHFRVGSFAFNGAEPDNQDAWELKRILAERHIPTERWHAGHRFALGEVVVEVLHPPQEHMPSNANDQSLVLRLSRNGKGLVLLPGDIEKDEIRNLYSKIPDLSAQVLVLPHHGAKSSYAHGFLERVSPRVALASAGFLNHFFLPSASVREELAKRNIPLLTTAEHGAVTIAWDFRTDQVKITTVRKGEVILQ